jgi:hypothetical protein
MSNVYYDRMRPRAQVTSEVSKMVISVISFVCVGQNVDAETTSPHWAHGAAIILDTAIGFALVIIALLGRYHILPLSDSLSEPLLIAGGMYIGMLTLSWIAHFKSKLCGDKCLFNSPLKTRVAADAMVDFSSARGRSGLPWV